MKTIFLLSIISIIFSTLISHAGKNDIYEIVTAENTILEDAPFHGYPIIPFENVILATQPVFSDLFYPSHLLQTNPTQTPYSVSKMHNSIINFFSGKKIPSPLPFPLPSPDSL